MPPVAHLQLDTALGGWRIRTAQTRATQSGGHRLTATQPVLAELGADEVRLRRTGFRLDFSYNDGRFDLLATWQPSSPLLWIPSATPCRRAIAYFIINCCSSITSVIPTAHNG
jgi:hypothetical protein